MIDARQRVAAPGRQNELLEVRRHDHLSGARTPRRCCYSSRLAASTRPRPARGHCWRIAPAEHHLVDKIAHSFAVSPVRRRTPTSPAQKMCVCVCSVYFLRISHPHTRAEDCYVACGGLRAPSGTLSRPSAVHALSHVPNLIWARSARAVTLLVPVPSCASTRSALLPRGRQDQQPGALQHLDLAAAPSAAGERERPNSALGRPAAPHLAAPARRPSPAHPYSACPLPLGPCSLVMSELSPRIARRPSRRRCAHRAPRTPRTCGRP